jgi:hypothetical protein
VDKGGEVMLKKFLFIMTMIMTLFIIEPKNKNNIFIVEEDDLIEWHSYEVGDVLV